MVQFEGKNSQLKIIIPISSMDELTRYQKGIMGLLNKIEVGNCDPVLKENLKSVYELLSHLLPDKDFLFQNKELFSHS